MKKIFFLFSIFLISTFSAISQAENFYVCDVNGNDEFDGQSETKPFKTYDKAIGNFNKLDAGGSLLFCRGGKFPANTQARLSNSSCSADKPCTIADYGNESLPRPIIAAYGVHAFNFENGGAAKSDGGYVVKNLTIMAAEKSGAGIRLYNDVDDLTISNVHIEGFNIGVYAANANTAAEGSDSNEANDRIILKNSNIIKNLKIGFLGSCNDCLIEGNNFENNGTHPSLDHNIYLSGSKKHKRGITIRNNTLYRSAIVDGLCQGVSLVGHGLLEDVLIENNVIKEDNGKVSNGCWGISIDPGYSKVDESFRNIVIRNNKIINVGGNAIGCASCEGVTIEGNEIIDEANKTTAGIKVPVRDENTVKSSNVIVKNNKVVLSHEGATGIWVGGENVSQIMGNEIILPINTRSDCISLNEASLKINISTNICKTHNGVSFNEDQNYSLPSQDDQQLAENPLAEEGLDEEQQILDSSRGDGNLNNHEQEIVNNSPIQEPTLVEKVTDSSTIEENTYIIPIRTNIVQETITNGGDSNNELIDEITQTSDKGSLIKDDSYANLYKKSRISTGGGASSKSKKSSSTTSDLPATADIISYTSPEPQEQVMYVDSDPESVQMDIIKGLPSSDSESFYSVKVKDVIQASREINDTIDVTQCRAYAAGRCLMK